MLNCVICVLCVIIDHRTWSEKSPTDGTALNFFCVACFPKQPYVTWVFFAYLMFGRVKGACLKRRHVYVAAWPRGRVAEIDFC